MTHDARTTLMMEEKIPVLMTKFAAPAIVSMLISAAYNVVDAIFVGLISTQAIAATLIAFPMFMLISMIGMAIGVGAGSYISRLLGEKNLEQAHKTGSTAVFTCMSLGILLTVLSLSFLRPLLLAFGATETILPYAIQYTGALLTGTLFSIVSLCLNNMLRAEGSVRMSMIGISAGAILNVALDPLFMFTFGLGVTGAAVATVLSQAISTGLLVWYYVNGKSLIKIRLRYWSFSGQIYSEIVKIGSPVILRQGLMSVAMAILNTTAGNYGDYAIAAMGIVQRVAMPGLFVVFGFAQGFQPIAGFSYGAKRYDRLLEAITVSMKRTTLFCTVLAAAFFVFPVPLIRLFSRDAEVIALGARGLRYFALFFPAFGFNVTTNVLFSAIGRALPAGILSLSRQGIFFIPALILLPQFFGLTGLLWSQPAADAATTLLTSLFAIRTLKQFQTLQSQMSEEPSAPIYS